MKNIVFWSPEQGQTGVTSNIIAVSALAALTMGKKVCLTHTHFNNTSLETALLGKKLSHEIFENMGVDFLLKSSKACDIDKNVIENASFTLLKGLYILPGTTKVNEELFEEDFFRNRACIYDALANSFDIVFTDARAGNNWLSKELMKAADTVVVNLNQNDRLIYDYANQYGYLDKKAVYILGNYHMNSRYNIQNLKRCYTFLKKKTAVIPFDVNYMDCFNDGKVIPFFLKNTLATREDDRNFFKQVRDSMELILQIPMEKEEMCC